jgi:hypothetical protein
MKRRTKAQNFSSIKELNENTNKSAKFWLKVWQDWALAFNNKQVIMQCCRGLVQFWQNFQT